MQELNEAFEGTRFVFTLGEDGTTAVQAFEAYDDALDVALFDLTTGGGVILLCVTVTAVSGALAVTGGALLGRATKSDLELRDAAIIQQETKWPSRFIGSFKSKSEYDAYRAFMQREGLSVKDIQVIAKETVWDARAIKAISSMDEYQIYKGANLKSIVVNGKTLLAKKNVNWNLRDEKGRSNSERVHKYKLAPIDETGHPYEIHHIGQNPDDPFAMLSRSEHRGSGNMKILHPKQASEVEHDPEFEKLKTAFLKNWPRPKRRSPHDNLR